MNVPGPKSQYIVSNFNLGKIEQKLTKNKIFQILKMFGGAKCREKQILGKIGNLFSRSFLEMWNILFLAIFVRFFQNWSGTQ